MIEFMLNHPILYSVLQNIEWFAGSWLLTVILPLLITAALIKYLYK